MSKLHRFTRLSFIFGAIAIAGVAIAGAPVKGALAAAQTSSHLDTVLQQMDAASAKFQSAQADLRQELFTKVVSDTETQTGMVYFERKGNSTQMGIKILPPNAQIVEFKDATLRIYNPGTNQIQAFPSTGKNQSLAETFLTLGFGGSGRDLAKAWTITDQGSEQITDGSKTVQVEKLDLVSKDDGVRKNFSHFTIWIDPLRGVSLKQVSYAASNGKPSGDTRTAYYTNIRLNEKVDTGPFAIKCKGKCS
jgi:outer membrane lipoprotein-sorting protein